MARRWFLVLVLFSALTALPSSSGQGKNEVLRIGLSGTMFHDLSEQQVKDALESMRSLIVQETKNESQLTVEKDWDKLAQQVRDGKFQMAVLIGHEYAWAKSRDPKLHSLIIAVNQNKLRHAILLAGKDSPAKGLADLKDKAVGLPKGSLAHVRLFLERQTEKSGAPKLATPANSEDAIDDLVDGMVQAVLVDGVSWEAYQRRKPGRAARLKELARSEPFPSPVIAYQQGAVDDATLKRFKDGMLKANQSEDGKRLLTFWKLTGFEAVPADYEKTVAEIVKPYPPK